MARNLRDQGFFTHRLVEMESTAEREDRIARLAEERAVRRFAGAEDRAVTAANVPRAMLPRTLAGPPVTVRESLQLVDVWAIVSTIARTAAQMPPVLYRRAGEGRERVSTGVGAELLRRRRGWRRARSWRLRRFTWRCGARCSSASCGA